MIVLKRDGREVAYDRKRIINAISRAMTAAGETDTTLAATEAQAVEKRFIGISSASVEDIQNAVEQQLMQDGLFETAKAYCVYRDQRTRARNFKSDLMKKVDEIVNVDARDDDFKRENANVDGNAPMGAMLQIGSSCARAYNDLYLLRPEQAKAHRDGDIHIHDYDFYALTMTCCQIDLLKLFHGGFSTGHGYLREPQSIQSYAALAAIAIQADQNDQHLYFEHITTSAA